MGWHTDPLIRDGTNTVSETTVSNTGLSEFFGPHSSMGGNSASSFQPLICTPNANSQSFFPELTEFAAELSEFCLQKQYSRNCILETVLRPLPI